MFTVATSKVAFEGFRTVYTEADEEKRSEQCSGQRIEHGFGTDERRV
mgnify:FL=1